MIIIMANKIAMMSIMLIHYYETKLRMCVMIYIIYYMKKNRYCFLYIRTLWIIIAYSIYAMIASGWKSRQFRIDCAFFFIGILYICNKLYQMYGRFVFPIAHSYAHIYIMFVTEHCRQRALVLTFLLEAFKFYIYMHMSVCMCSHCIYMKWKSVPYYLYTHL